MNTSNDYRFLYEKMRTSLIQHRENLIRDCNNAISPHIKHVYAALDRLLREIVATPETDMRNHKIAKTFQWYRNAMKQHNVSLRHNKIRCTNINFYFPFEKQGVNNNNRKDIVSVLKINTKLGNKDNGAHVQGQTNKTRSRNLIECVHTTNKYFNFSNNINNINSISHKALLHNNVTQPSHNSQRVWFKGQYDNVKDNFKHLIDVRKHKHSERHKQRIFPLTEGNSNNSFSTRINREIIISVDKPKCSNTNTERGKQSEVSCNKRKKAFKRYKIKKRNHSVSKSAFKSAKALHIIKPPNTAGSGDSSNDNNIIDVLKGVKLDETNFNKEMLPMPKQYNLTIFTHSNLELVTLLDALQQPIRVFTVA